MPPNPAVVASVSEDQQAILADIARLHLPEGDWYEVDATYGNGAFWRGLRVPPLRFDIDPQVDGVTAASAHHLPLDDAAVGSVVYDPPFLTYVRRGRDGNGAMLMAGRFSGYWRYDELEDDYRASITEFARVVRPGGMLVVKCQDIVHNHRLHLTHQRVLEMAAAVAFRPLDLFVLTAGHRLPSPNRAGRQRHARIHHSYFLVFRRLKGVS